MSEELPPGLDHLFRALTADGDADELARRDTALTMFRDSRHPSPRRRRLRFPASMRMGPLRVAVSTRMAVSMRMAVAAVVIIGGIAGAAYAAILPASVQHVAYHLLDGIGVPDAHHPPLASGASGSAGPAPSAPASGASGAGAPGAPGSVPSAPASGAAGATAAAGCPCQDGQPTAGATVSSLVLSVAQAQIPADGADVFSGEVTSKGQPEAGVQVRLYEHAAGRPGWRLAGSAVTDSGGDLTLTVSHLIRNASFRATAPWGAASTAVPVTVVPAVYLDLIRHPLLGIAIGTVRAGFADTGDVVILQELSGTSWVPVGEQVLGAYHRAHFTVSLPQTGGQDYRVVLPGTSTHGPSVSGPVSLAPR